MTMDRMVRVERKVQEAVGICSFDLVAIDGRPVPAFSAGAHIDVHLADGIVRQYSLCNPPSERHRYQIAVLLEPDSRGGSSAMHAVSEGQSLRISEPKNHFPLVEAGSAHNLLIAGGIGITPILCMAEQLAAVGGSFELHYCTRTAERSAFVQRIASAPFAERSQVYQMRGLASASSNSARCWRAVPPRRICMFAVRPASWTGVLDTAARAGWPEERLHREYFAAPVVDTDGDQAFEVQIASTGQVIEVPVDRSVTAALADAGICVPVSCEQGVCGTCLVRVIDGTPDHRDAYLTGDEQAGGQMMLPCCSRSKSARIVLDL